MCNTGCSSGSRCWKAGFATQNNVKQSHDVDTQQGTYSNNGQAFATLFPHTRVLHPLHSKTTLPFNSAVLPAGKLAGLDTVRLIREPVAAALAYGLDLAEEQVRLGWVVSRLSLWGFKAFACQIQPQTRPLCVNTPATSTGPRVQTLLF